MTDDVTTLEHQKRHPGPFTVGWDSDGKNYPKPEGLNHVGTGPYTYHGGYLFPLSRLPEDREEAQAIVDKMNDAFQMGRKFAQATIRKELGL
jgi:hypothetical protein